MLHRISLKLALPVLTLALAGTSCHTAPSHRLSRDELSAAARNPIFTSLDVEEIESLRPQIDGPIRLAVAPPLERTRGSWQPDLFSATDGDTFKVSQWSAAERERIEAWREELRADGLVEDVVVLSGMLVETGGEPTTDSFLPQVRAAAARTGADAVLLVHRAHNTYGSDGPLALLDLTIVGAAIIPGHELHAQAVVEGIVIDTRNEFLYLSGAGYAERERSSSAWRMDARARDLTAQTEEEALERLAADLRAQARSQLGRP